VDRAVAAMARCLDAPRQKNQRLGACQAVAAMMPQGLHCVNARRRISLVDERRGNLAPRRPHKVT